VFVRNGTSWSQEAYLKASNTGLGDNFGNSVAVDGPTVVVGARGEWSAATGVNGDESDDSMIAAGAAYVFARAGSVWKQEAYLKASNTEMVDLFGASVAVHGDVVAVGAEVEDSAATGVNGNGASNAAPSSGAAYVFRRSGGTWSHRAYVKASNTSCGDFFGSSVGLTSDVLVVGAVGEDSAAAGVNGDESDESSPDAGAVYAFDLGYPPAVRTRNFPPNPLSYTAAPTVIGGTFTATVDNALAGQATSLLFAFDSYRGVILGGGQVLLCIDLHGNGELFTGANLAPSSSAAGVDSYSLAVPDAPSLIGFAFFSQAIQFGNPPFDLSNAQDLTIGGF
jgi:hypothetical protein